MHAYFVHQGAPKRSLLQSVIGLLLFSLVSNLNLSPNLDLFLSLSLPFAKIMSSDASGGKERVKDDAMLKMHCNLTDEGHLPTVTPITFLVRSHDFISF